MVFNNPSGVKALFCCNCKQQAVGWNQSMRHEKGFLNNILFKKAHFLKLKETIKIFSAQT